MLSILVWIEDLFGKLLLAAIVLLIFFAAIARNAGYPLIWSVDMAQALFVWLCFTGAVKALRQRAHIGVDYFVQKLPFGWRRGVDLAMAVIVVVFLAVLAWFGFQLTVMNAQRIFGDSGLSYAWVTGAVPLGASILALVLAAQVFVALRDKTLVFAKSRADDSLHQEL